MKVSKNHVTTEVYDMSQELLQAIEVKYPLQDSVVGVRLLDGHVHNDWCCSDCTYLCNLHLGLAKDLVTPLPITLKETLEEAAFCLQCHTFLGVPPGMPEWDTLRDRLCNGDYSKVEIFTEYTIDKPTHVLFNFKRLVPGSSKVEHLMQYGDYSAKHAVDYRREEWPNGIEVEEDTFDTEVARRLEGKE